MTAAATTSLLWAALGPALALALTPSGAPPSLLFLYLPVHVLAGAAVGHGMRIRLVRHGTARVAAERAGAGVFAVAVLSAGLWALGALVVP